MWKDRIIQEKERLRMSTKIMSEHTNGHLPERTIARILSGETENPRIDTIIELGEAVGLTPKELFADTDVVVATESLVATSETLAQTTETLTEVKNVLEEVKETTIVSDVEKTLVAKEISDLKDEINSARTEIELLKAQIKQKDNIIKLISNIANLNIGEI